MELLSLPGIVLCLTIADFVHDPRKLRIGVSLLALTLMGVSFLFTQVFGSLQSGEPHPETELLTWALAAVILLIFIGVVALGVALTINGITMIRNEGRSLSHMLSFIVGIAILGYTGAGLTAAFLEKIDIVAMLVVLGIPLGWVGYGLIAFVGYSFIYIRLARRFGGPVGAVVVLGAGVPDGRVRPLLASRIREGIRWQAREDSRGRRPLLVMSGGQGPDEPLPEAEAMARWAREAGAPADRLFTECRSSTTDENLQMSAALIQSYEHGMRYAVVTSGYHAFRAATLMRSHQMPGYAIGAPTARYYVPSAMLREYIAIVCDHLWLNIIALALLFLPFILGLMSQLHIV